MEMSRLKVSAVSKTLLAFGLAAGAVIWAWQVVAWERKPSHHWMRQLRDSDPDQRAEAVTELRGLPDLDDPRQARELLPSLLRAIHDKDAAVRLEVVRALGHVARRFLALERAASKPATVRDLRTIVDALAALGGDPSATVRAEVATGLGPLAPTSEQALQVILRALKDREPNVRQAAMIGIDFRSPVAKRVFPAIREALDDQDAKVRRAALVSVDYDAPLVRTLLSRLVEATRDEDAMVRGTAVWALTRFPERLPVILPLILAAGHDPDQRVREMAGSSFGLLVARPHGSVKTAFDLHAALPSLLEALRDRRPFLLRRQIVEALGDAEGPDREPASLALIDELRNDDPEVRRFAAFSLGQTAAPDSAVAVSGLLDAVNDLDEHARNAAVVALMINGGGGAMAPIPASLRGSERSRKGVAVLADILNDPAHRVRRGFAFPVAPDLRREPWMIDVVEGAVRALGRFGAEAEPALGTLEALREREPRGLLRDAAVAARDRIRAAVAGRGTTRSAHPPEGP